MRLEEQWKFIKETNKLYEVSNLGRVRSKKRSGSKGGIIKQSLAHDGYYELSISVGGAAKNKKVHKLVAQAYLGSRPDGYQINHKDGNKINNCANNLEYVTHKENCAHAAALGLYADQRGEKNHNAKITKQIANKIRLGYKQGIPVSKLAVMYGGSVNYVIYGGGWQ